MSTKKLDTAEFIRRAKEKHGDRYDYSKTVYVNARTKLCIICAEHGEMWMTPVRHLKSCGCTTCGLKKPSVPKKTTEQYIEDCKEKYPESTDIFDKAEYKGSAEKIEIGCVKHGYYWVNAGSYLIDGTRCAKCQKLDLETAKQRIEAHDHGYCLDNLNFEKYTDTVEIGCSKHGKVSASLISLMRGGKCPKCAREDVGDFNRTNLQEFISQSKEKHGEGVWGYDKTKITPKSKKVILTCLKCQNDVTVTKGNHLHGNKGQGHRCPHCSHKRSLLEREIEKWLVENQISFEIEKSFPDCRNINELPFDYWLPKFNILIEAQGVQHVKIVEVFGGQEAFESQQKRDKIKYDWAEQSEYTLHYINYDEDVEERLKQILIY